MDKCIRCYEEHQDQRTIRVSCLYQLTELSIPFTLEEDENANGKYTYCVKVCKSCRADFMDMMQGWWEDKAHERGLAEAKGLR